MSTRDQFAAQAMMAILSNSELKLLFKVSGNDYIPQWNKYVVGKYGEKIMHGEDVLAKLAFEAADAMMKLSHESISDAD